MRSRAIRGQIGIRKKRSIHFILNCLSAKTGLHLRPMPPAAKALPYEFTKSSALVRGDSRAPDVVAFEVALVDFFVRGAELLGVPRSVAAIYGIIFASPAPLSFADVEARLDISKGSISQGMRVLRNIGAVRVVEGNDIRRDYFAPDLELRKLVVHFLDERLQRQLSDGSERLKQLSRAVPDSGAGNTATLRERIRQLKNWHDKTKSIVPVIKTLLALTKSI
jgi:DNA-binding transcriptional regulator GbsR (MarR family)